MSDILQGVMLPFIGTSLGAAGVFPMKRQLGGAVRRVFAGFAAGVMTAASIWSLLIPAIEQAGESFGRTAFFPAAVGVVTGVVFMILLGSGIKRLCEGGRLADKLPQSTMLLIAVTLHNIPEGMAVGVAYAGVLCGSGGGGLTAAAALALSAGIAIQNFPEGAIISLPLKAEGKSRAKAFAAGVLSGVVEPVGAALTIIAAGAVTPAMPYLLSFAAGAMLYAVTAELIPEMNEKSPTAGALSFTGGFVVMMTLDVMLG